MSHSVEEAGHAARSTLARSANGEDRDARANRIEPVAHDVRDNIEVQIYASDKLSEHQKNVSAQLRLLYQSLCGEIPGQTWPQALLDSAGNFDRPSFPHRGRR